MNRLDQKLYEIPRVFIQGDRDPNMEQAAAATLLGAHLKERNWGTTVGAYGGLVKIMEETGVSCICHETEMKDHGDVKATTAPIVDCRQPGQLVVDLLGGGAYVKAQKEISWAIRLGTWMGTSKAFCFFAGREGTLAHLVPVLAMNAKGWSKTKARPVVLFGWELTKIAALLQLFGYNRKPGWLETFDLNEVERVVQFLTA